MRQSSIVIHRGKKEEKYEIYVEDYVISFLKEKEGTLRETEILFYGRKERNGRRYTIYGAGQDRNLDIFGKYELLEEIGCRLTQEGPVFLVREKSGTYEVKGYDIFYYDNEEMQDYLIHQGNSSSGDIFTSSRQEAQPRTPGYIAGQAVQSGKKANAHYAVSLQLGFIFIILVAIVINSTNSYDKMEQLNQSAEEVFFVMENQEAEETAAVQNDIVVQRDVSQDSTLQENVQLENANSLGSSGSSEEGKSSSDMQTQNTDAEDNADMREKTAGSDGGEEIQIQKAGSEDGEGISSQKPEAENSTGAQTADASTSSEEKTQQDEAESGNSVEALSRNVARYYEVKRGDTLYMISQKIYGDITHVDKICEANQITDPDSIHYGQKIILP